MKKKITKSFLSVVLVLSMMFGMSIVSSAATVQTDTYSWNGGTYTLYVRKAGNNDVLGYMQLSHTTTSAQNTFTAAQDCKTTTVKVAHDKDTSLKPNSVPYLGRGSSVTVTKSGINITTVSGNCTVSY